MIPTDPLYAQQWHLTLIGNIQTIWNEYSGDGVTVAVYDEGVQYSHPDLNDNYDAASHFTFDDFTYDGGPVYARNAHGTAVAGLIGAEANNGLGGVGVAFDVTMTSQNFLDVTQFEVEDSPEERAAFLWAAGFDIMNNSWGRTPEYSADQSLADPASERSRLNEIYGQIAATGRGGLGTIIVQAAGNERVDANGDGLNVSRFTITVAATGADGFATDYSNFGSSILVAAPAAEVTTDMLGNAGYNTGSDDDPLDPGYTGTFDGTSAATPVVAGVVALMLEANPDLGWRDVQNILAMSASHTGSALGGPGQGNEVGVWRYSPGLYAPTTAFWNAGFNGYHASYGYGMVDAFAAVRMAEAWLVMQGPARTSGNEQIVTIDSPTMYTLIPDFEPAFGNRATTRQLNVTQNISIETVYATVDISHGNLTDLILTLIDPAGAKAVLLANDATFTDWVGGFRWTFAVESLRGHFSAGAWKLEITDTARTETGSIIDFDLQIFGSAASVDDVYHFTDDFLEFRALNATRGVLNERNGGTDWLNFSAVSGDVVAGLGQNSLISVDRVFWFRLETGFIESIHGGDGADVLTGNRADNTLYGARGRDILNGDFGEDSLDGGLGDDRLLGGNGNDNLLGGDGRDYLDGGRNADTMTGGGGPDAFVFAFKYGLDVITDFTDNIDTLRLDNRLWAGVLTVQQVITTFATNLAGGGVLLDFGDSELTLAGLVDRQVLINDILII